jgi:hypothetical protein
MAIRVIQLAAVTSRLSNGWSAAAARFLGVVWFRFLFLLLCLLLLSPLPFLRDPLHESPSWSKFGEEGLEVIVGEAQEVGQAHLLVHEGRGAVPCDSKG